VAESSRRQTRLRTTVNGHAHDLEIEPRESLAEVLRDRLHLTGTNVSCDVQICGACTMLGDGMPGHFRAWRASSAARSVPRRTRRWRGLNALASFV
jgi:aerobic-type carbon monoxide dehydrogenase small subunit (CoxS/CutS family)